MQKNNAEATEKKRWQRRRRDKKAAAPVESKVAAALNDEGAWKDKA